MVKVRAARTPAGPYGRPTCYRCFRPDALCLCSRLVPFEAHVDLLVLQHPNERMKYFSTAKLVSGLVSNSRLARGVEFEDSALRGLLDGRSPYILFPSAEAVDCRTVPLSRDDVVIVVDGTWSEAGKVLNRNPMLRGIPRLTFTETFESNYRIRKQPRLGYLSTIESVAKLLTLNAAISSAQERTNEYAKLLYWFDYMVDRQIEIQERHRRAARLGPDVL